MKQLLKKLLLASVLAFGFLVVSTAIAQTPECERLKEQLSGNVAALPQYCDIGSVYSRITFWLYYIIGIAAVVSIIYGGYLYMTSRGNDAQLAKAKNVLIWTIAGVVLALLAAVIINVVVNLIVDNRLT